MSQKHFQKLSMTSSVEEIQKRNQEYNKTLEVKQPSDKLRKKSKLRKPKNLFSTPKVQEKKETTRNQSANGKGISLAQKPFKRLLTGDNAYETVKQKICAELTDYAASQKLKLKKSASSPYISAVVKKEPIKVAKSLVITVPVKKQSASQKQSRIRKPTPTAAESRSLK